ncbi:toll-like receptor 13 [Lingula anatina]|uniref:Toll-like receptor 13 n=1 Tax=Lingula anatina TaxID=7574 RepID=A0A2R2MK09_LINAN|nr:toll-like receptor 13 [Lingula anatina]|eukprot:XP_023930402.1 toll-like receptor 13 [Lingula anatina]
MLHDRRRDGPIICTNERINLFSNLTQLDLSNNGIHALPGSIFADLTDLRILLLRGNNLDTVETNTFAGLRNLRWLDLRDNQLDKIPNFGNETHPFFPKLFELSLGKNNINSVTPTDFIALQSAEKLDLGWNLIKILPGNMFKYMPKLQHVLLRNQRNLRSILQMAFASNSLIYLDISVNKYTFSSDRCDIFSNSPNLHDLSMHDNQLNDMNSTALETVFRNLTKLRKLYLQNSKLANLPAKMFVNNGMLNWHPTKAQCTPLPAWVIASAIGVSIMLFLALVIVVSHRYRWYIRYWCFTLRSRYKRLEPFEDNGAFVFDAFVSYNCHDRHWVIQRLLPKLEYDAGFKLCLHDRDFIVGHDIVDNIVDALEVSRKAILVLSNNFAQSQWCQLEMTMAQHKLFDENKDILVLILLEDIKPENLSNRLTLLLRKQTYIEWPREEEGQELFWERVKASLQIHSGHGML